MYVKIASQPPLLVSFSAKEKEISQVTLCEHAEGLYCSTEGTSKSEAAEIQEWLYLYSQKKELFIPSFLNNYLSSKSEFSQKVLASLLSITWGQTETYASIAHKVGNPRASRAVGGALNRNHFPLFLPCHRVIGAKGSLTGFAFGIKMKKLLLDFEAS